MTEMQQSDVRYTATVVQDLLEKASYITQQLQDTELAAAWYARLRGTIQQNLSFFPYKYPLHNAAPWREQGVRQFVSRYDVILYSLDAQQRVVHIRSVCARGRDLSAHLAEQETPEEEKW